MGFLSDEELLKSAASLELNGYGEYLRALLEDPDVG
jgi:hypothetical protein